MAKHILVSGVYAYEAYCQACGCKFTYEVADIDRGIVTCPCCGNAMSHDLGRMRAFGMYPENGVMRFRKEDDQKIQAQAKRKGV